MGTNIVARLKQPSSWIGIAIIATQFATGTVTPEAISAFLTGVGLVATNA